MRDNYDETTANSQELAIPKMPIQRWSGNLYDLHTAIKEGTIFPELNKIFYLGEDNRG